MSVNKYDDATGTLTKSADKVIPAGVTPGQLPIGALVEGKGSDFLTAANCQSKMGYGTWVLDHITYPEFQSNKESWGNGANFPETMGKYAGTGSGYGRMTILATFGYTQNANADTVLFTISTNAPASAKTVQTIWKTDEQIVVADNGSSPTMVYLRQDNASKTVQTIRWAVLSSTFGATNYTIQHFRRTA